MAEAYDLIVRGGVAVTPDGRAQADIGVREGLIAAMGDLARASAGQVIEARGLHVLPGVIDTQVHFREPGLEHKEDIATGTAGAVLGGVTAVFDMPNTNPSTLSAADLADKVARARGRARSDIAFFVGAAEQNMDRLDQLERLPGAAGIKLFMGSSTGDLLVADDEGVSRVLAAGFRRVAVHAEDEERLRARRALIEAGATAHMHPVW
ncbi:MAG: amidohydrolase family protein, partial [Alphaproteobacteria bacterium]